MHTSLFEGIWVPLVTPFRNGRLDLDGLQRLTAHMIDSGVHGLVACGTTGEAAMLDDAEQEQVLAAVLEAADGRCPVLMGLAGSDTRSVAATASRWNRFALAGLLASAPAYVRPSQHGILLHFDAIAIASEHPIVLYNIPARTGVNIDATTAMKLSSSKRFAAIKECSGNLAQLGELIHSTPLVVLCGDDALMLPMLALGARGAITAAAHLRPELYVRLFGLVRAGRIAEAHELFQAMLPFIHLLFSEPNPAPVKAALALQGRIANELRLPMTPMPPIGQAALERALDTFMALPSA